MDAHLNLPECDFSYVLQAWDQEFCVQNSYEKSSHTVEEILGIGQSVRSLESMNCAMAQDMKTYWESQSAPLESEEGEILVATLDGKGVPIRRRPEAEREKTPGRRKRGGESQQNETSQYGCGL